MLAFIVCAGIKLKKYIGNYNNICYNVNFFAFPGATLLSFCVFSLIVLTYIWIPTLCFVCVLFFTYEIARGQFNASLAAGIAIFIL